MLFNKARARELMNRAGIDVLVTTSPTNITYMTDYHCWVDAKMKEYMIIPGASDGLIQGFAVFALEGPAALVVNADMVQNARDCWVRDVHTYGDTRLDNSLGGAARTDEERRVQDVFERGEEHATSTDALVRILKDRGLEAARIGLEKASGPYAQTIAACLPRASIKDATSLILLTRMVKTEDEIGRLTRAAEISEQAATEALELARPGRSIQEASRAYRARIAQDGADFDHFAFGPGGLGFGTEPDYILRDDEVMYVDYGCIYRQCYSDTGTTLATNSPPDELLTRHAATRDCVAAGHAAMRPGVKASEVCEAMWEVLRERGIANASPHGHGLGLELRGYPIIVADNGRRIRDDCVDIPSDLTLEENMVVNLESPLCYPGVGSVHVEQTFLVTEGGSRLLLPQRRETPFLPASPR